MGFLADDLIKKTPFDYSYNEKVKNGEFYQSLIEELRFHYNHNSLYKKFCDNKGFNPNVFDGDLSEIPPVQVSVFKSLGKMLTSVPNEHIKLTLQSSATSGIPSSVPVDSVTSKRQARAMIKVVSDFIGNERKPFLVMDVDPASGYREILGARYAAVSGYLNFASDVGYFLKVNSERKYYFDINAIEQFINALDGQNAVVFGFTYILYAEIVLPLNQKGIRFSLPQGSKVIHIGGWKKLESDKVDKAIFNKMTADVFGVDETDVIDIYGFTEQMGLNYPDCPCGCKHVPLYSEVLIRDIITKDVLPAGQEGLMEFLTPVPHSYPGNAVLTDDIGIIEKGKCPFGRSGTRFRMVGRLKKAEIRGCGDILSNKLRFAESTEYNKPNFPKESLRIYYDGRTDFSFQTAEECLEQIGKELKKNLSWLRQQPIDALIGLISQIAKKWELQAYDFNKMQNQGLRFLISWCSPENLIRIANEGLRGNRRYINSFIPMDDTGVRMLKATSRGLVCHWLAGNVQVLGMFVLIQSVLTGNVNLVRVSKRDNGVFQSLLKAFENETFTTPGGYSINGNDLLRTIAIMFFEHSDIKAGKKMSELADVRVAWGGSEAVSAVSNFPSKFDCVDIIMGPKLSMSVVSKEAISDERRAKKLARKIAVDASVFDQTGCASTHNVFVEAGGNITPEEFASYLADGMSKVSKQIPKGNMSPEEYAAIHSVRGIYDFKGKVYGDVDSVWTVLFEEDRHLNSPVYSRVVFVKPINELNDVLEFISDDIQTIGLAVYGEKAYDFAKKAAEKGAIRFPSPGKMLNFESPWDGMFIMDRLVRWNTLGGPLL